MMRPLYTLAVIGAQPFLRRKLKRRGVAEPGYLEHVEERLGIFHPREDYIIHALGERRAAYIADFAKLQPKPKRKKLMYLIQRQ